MRDLLFLLKIIIALALVALSYLHWKTYGFDSFIFFPCNITAGLIIYFQRKENDI